MSKNVEYSCVRINEIFLRKFFRAYKSGLAAIRVIVPLLIYSYDVCSLHLCYLLVLSYPYI